MTKTAFHFVFAVLMFIATPLQCKTVNTLNICGTGDSQEILRFLAYSFEAINPDIKVAVPNSIGSCGGIRAVIEGNCDLARIARPLNKNEKSLDLSYHLFALSPVVFVLHPAMELPKDLNEKQIAGIFKGDISNWNQVGGNMQKIYLVNREIQDSSRAIIDIEVAGFKEIVQFPGRTFFSIQDTVDAMLTYRQTIGYMPLITAIKNKLHTLSFNGISPTAANVGEKKYPLITPLALAWVGELSSDAQKFITFLHSSAAVELMAGQGIFAPSENEL